MNRFVMGCIFLLYVFTSTLWATDRFEWIPVKVRTQQDGLLHWVRSEAYRDLHPDFTREKILKVSRYKNSQVLEAFPSNLYDEDSADSSLMVLFYGPRWYESTKTPILLVHGAADNAYRAWVHPLSVETPDTVEKAKWGFMQQFAEAGYPVFAINFSHNHGCNYKQAEQIHNAIQVIKRKTGAKKVHLIAHSKGNCAASIYLCGGKDVNPEYCNFISSYKQDVAAYIQIGAGNKGIDLIFRYYTGNIFTLTSNLSSPVCFHSGVTYGFWGKFYKKDIYLKNPGKAEGNYFPGQCQLLYNLVDDGLNFSAYSYTPFDFNMTMKACYYGGTTAVVSCYGIHHAIKEGGNTISRVNQRGLHPSISLINIYGTNQVIQEIKIGLIKIPMGVSDYPSDGIVYVHSAKYIDGLISRGAPLLGQKGFKLNHFGIGFYPQVFQWIIAKLPK